MQTRDYTLRNITWPLDHAGRLDWAPDQAGRFVFDGRGSDGYYDVYVADADGSNRTCLTEKPDILPQRHIGNPSWHPSGDYIVFQAEKAVHPGDSTGATPGAGLWSDLWLMTSDGERFFQLTDIATNRAQGVLHPHFSHDGAQLLWAERLQGFQQAENYGEWCIRVADFAIGDSPLLTNIRTLQPGTRHMWYETHGFDPDDATIIFAGDLETEQAIDEMDIYTLDLHNDRLTNLTTRPHSWDEHAHISPDGDKIVWMSNQGFPGRGEQPWFHFMQWLATELWIMNADGTDKRQLTWFNDVSHPHYLGGRVIAADGDWNRAGDKYAVLVNIHKPGSWEERIAVLEFD